LEKEEVEEEVIDVEEDEEEVSNNSPFQYYPHSWFSFSLSILSMTSYTKTCTHTKTSIYKPFFSTNSIQTDKTLLK
jgi:hypothetical protein